MRQFTCLFLVLSCLGLVMSQHVWAGSSLMFMTGLRLPITSPQKGATVGSSFDLAYSFRKGVMADHVHVFMDGTYQKGFKGTLNEVPSGRYTITVKVATHDHDMVTVSDSIVVVVK